MSPCFLIHLVPATCCGGAWGHLGPCYHLRCPQEVDKDIGLSVQEDARVTPKPWQ